MCSSRRWRRSWPRWRAGWRACTRRRATSSPPTISTPRWPASPSGPPTPCAPPSICSRCAPARRAGCTSTIAATWTRRRATPPTPSSADTGERHDESRLVAEVASASRHYGRLMAVSPAAGFFPHERELLDVYARYAAAVLDTATALDDARRRHDQARALLELAQNIAVAGTREEVAQRLVDAVPVVVDCDRVAVFLWNESDDALTCHAVTELTRRAGRTRARARSPPLRHSSARPLGRRSRSAAAVLRSELRGRVRRRHPRADGKHGPSSSCPSPPAGGSTASSTSAWSITASGCVPQPPSSTSWPAWWRRLPPRWTTRGSSRRCPTRLVTTTSPAFWVTAPSRRRSTSTCGVDGPDPTFTLATIDIDDFKRVNDAHGHPVGDEALCHVAEALDRAVRDQDSSSGSAARSSPCCCPV